MKKAMVLMSIGCIFLLSSCSQSLTVPPKTHPKVSSWSDLFAPDLSNAIYPKGVWTFEDGVLTASEDQCIWTKKDYDNFILDLEFKTRRGHQQRRDRLLQRHEELDSQLGRDPDRRRLRRASGLIVPPPGSAGRSSATWHRPRAW